MVYDFRRKFDERTWPIKLKLFNAVTELRLEVFEMGVPVFGFDDFSDKFYSLKDKKKLFGFFFTIVDQHIR
jgi:hypothetical protein